MENKTMISGAIKYIDLHNNKNICWIFNKNVKHICHFDKKIREKVLQAFRNGNISIEGYLGKKNIVEIREVKND